MQGVLTLGSLFDGIGGFPLSGVMHGIKPVWASEIEPFPILVTTKRFPNMKRLGSVTDIKGDQVEPVDIITFGSPCQDLSVAGAQKGIHDGARSSLFFEAVRIIKEMREHDRATSRTGQHVRPRFAVWENVPGAYSSNKGRDFQAVLQALCEVADPDVHVPFPEGGKWQKAGCIVGEGYSVAWRTLDAQYFPRTPQRRKRIYLVADFGSERAGEILFKPHSVRGNPAEGGKEGQGGAEDAERGVRRSGGADCVTAFHLQQDLIPNDRISPCIGGQHQATIGVFMGGQGPKAGGIAYDESVSPTLRASPSGSNQVPDTVYCLQGNGIDRADTAGCNGCGWRIGAYTLNTIDRPAVVYDTRGNGDGGVSPTLTGDHQNRVTDYTAICVENGQLNQITMAEKSNTLDCMHDQQVVLTDGKPPRKYIVRRLTPLECCRMQGYPDGWTENIGKDEPTEEEIAFFTEVWARWADINGTKPKSRAQVIKWLKDPGSDSAEYKAYGNSLAIPCSSDVLGRIAAFAEEEKNEKDCARISAPDLYDANR